MTWRIVGHPIAHEILRVDLHLSEDGVHGEIAFTGIVLITTIDCKEF